jgi:hypothetical protein
LAGIAEEMTDKLEEKIRKGKAAKLILADPNVDEVLSSLGSEWIEKSYKSATIQEREDARFRLMALDDLRGSLETLASNGREAERELERNK